MIPDNDIVYMGDKSKPTYAWTASADPELVAYCQFINAGLPKSFHKMLIRKKRVRDDGRLLSSLWREARARVFARDDYTCRYCGHRGGQLECDHVIAHSRGGSSDDSNLVTACLTCNRSKRDKTLEEWMAA